MINPKLFFQVVHVEKDKYRVDVTFENIPKKFLGAAFEVVTKEQAWTYEGYKIGSIFTPQSSMALVTTRDAPEKKIIFGVTLKRGFAFDSVKGNLVSFYLRFPNQAHPEIAFKRGVISVFEGERKNIEQVLWQNSNSDREVEIIDHKEKGKNTKVVIADESQTQQIAVPEDSSSTQENIDGQTMQNENSATQLSPLMSSDNFINCCVGLIISLIFIILLLALKLKKQNKF